MVNLNWEIVSITFAIFSGICLGTVAFRVDGLVKGALEQILPWHEETVRDFNSRLLLQKRLIVIGVTFFVISEIFHLLALP